jgi:acetyl-CoA acyltransferase
MKGDHMSPRVAIVDGLRTPFCKAGGVLKELRADDLGAYVVKELLARTSFPAEQVDQLIFGNVLQSQHRTNMARIVGVKAGLPLNVPAVTVNRNCASGLESISQGAAQILLGKADAVIVGGSESMSNIEITFPREMNSYLQLWNKAKSFGQKLTAAAAFRPHLLQPLLPNVFDPLCDLTMGQTAELLAREFAISRQRQDLFALQSHQRASAARQKGYFDSEIIPLPIPPQYGTFQNFDDSIRDDSAIAALASLKPVFNKLTGTVTAGNASPLTDGAVALLLLSEDKARKLGYKPLGYFVADHYAGLEPSRMGLGPVFASAKALADRGISLKEIDLIELNEAFAVQVLACQQAFDSPQFCQKELTLPAALGILDDARLNVNGGAIAIGHPLGASGSRMVLTLLKELQRQNKRLGLATMCIGGGQGGAIIVEAAQ